MSTDAQSGDGPEAPVAVLDGLAIYGAEQPFFDPDRAIAARRTEDDRRVYLIAKLDVRATTPSASGHRRTLGLYATTDGRASIRFAGDEGAQVDGLLAHSLVEPVDRLLELDSEAQELLANHVADLSEVPR